MKQRRHSNNGHNRPTKEQVQRWKLKDWEKNWDKNLIANILNNIKTLWEEGGTIVAPSYDVLGYLLSEDRISYLLHSLIKLQNKGRITLIKKGDDYYLDYIPF